MDEAQFVETTSPDEAFAALSADVRVSILRTLWEIEGYEASFSELREAVGMRDSGQFNYHLDKLVGPFVARTDAGYELTEAGRQINGTIEAGVFTVEATIEPILLEAPCPICDGERTLVYEGETVLVECDSCPVSAQFGVPPSVLAGRNRKEIPDVAGRYLLTTLQHLVNGFCIYCDGAIDRTVAPIDSYLDEDVEDVPSEIADRTDRLPFVTCTRCSVTATGGLSTILLTNPRVATWFADRGIDVRSDVVWEYAGLDPDRQRILGLDPVRAGARYDVDGSELRVEVDEELEIVSIEA